MQNVQSRRRDETLYKACQDFEAIFVKQMLKSMKNTIDKSGLLGGGFAEEIYDDNISRKINADVYIDDRNLGGLPGWSAVWQMLNPEDGKAEELQKIQPENQAGKGLKRLFRKS